MDTRTYLKNASKVLWLSPLPVKPFVGKEDKIRPFSDYNGLNRLNWLNRPTYLRNLLFLR